MERMIMMLVRGFLWGGAMKLMRKGFTYWGNRNVDKQGDEQANMTRKQTKKNTNSASKMLKFMRRMGRF